MKILAIGNSFAQDAMHYLHNIARADGVEVQAVNLYIGGCTLERHYRNLLGNKRDYTLHYNGHSTGFPMSLEEALTNREWDVVIMHQASPVCTKIETYFPYMQVLADAVRRYQPHAKLVVNQTWSYEDGCERMEKFMHYTDANRMFTELEAAYNEAAERIHADGMIRSGALFRMLTEKGIEKIHRDTYHASRGVGRYALGLLWYHSLCGVDITENTFSDFDVPVTAEEVALVKSCVSTFEPLFKA